ncbi:MAG TPA: thiamine pyrophosphate-binding protein [Bryobacteraceae bacterium]|nr:thiamine pyrophosphate-binding protein [Bryobacteraceae bacterium]
MPNGAELFVQTIAGLGIDTIFTLVGDHLNEVLLAAAHSGIRIVDMRHESAVTHAADAWARIHRKPALSLVTGGPGHTNSLTGIATANLAGSPLIAVSGSRASTMAHRQAFQDIDQVEMARPVVKWASEPPCAAEIPFYLRRAYTVANTGRKGAVHLTIPVDLFCSAGGLAASPIAGGPVTGGKTAGAITANAGAITVVAGATTVTADAATVVAGATTVLDMLRAAQRPVVIAGSGVWWSGAEDALRRFLDRTSFPLYTITMARGAVSDEHPLAMGYADPALNYAVHSAFREADLFLVVGKRIDYRLAMGGSRLFPPEARFIQIDIHAEEFGLNRRLDAAICADARAALDALSDAVGPEPWAPLPWLDRVRELRRDWEARLADIIRQDGPSERAAAREVEAMHPAAFFRELRAALPRDVLYSWDGGDFAHWGRAMLPAREAGGWLRLGPLGTIGSSLPNGLALQLAHPGRRVAVITGDGALGFYIAEMDSAVRHKLPIVLIVGNDAGWGLERELQSFANPGAATVACELQSARYDLIMKGFGGQGESIERLDQVGPAVERAFASGVPYCLNVKIRGVRSPFTEWQIAGKRK